jgi:polar amino acid transport system substrate-binding protein
MKPVFFMQSIQFFLFFFATQSAIAQETLVLSTTAQPPYHTSEETGIIDRILQEALERLNYKIKIFKLPAERALIAANSGLSDGDPFRVAGLENKYPNLISVPESLFSIEFVAFANRVDFPTISWNSLNPYSIGIITGWKIFENNLSNAAQITKVEDKTQLFNILIKNRVDVILYSKLPGLNHIRTQKIRGVKLLQPPIKKKKMFLYLHKKHRHLIPKIADSLRAMKVDGVYQRIVKLSPQIE